MHFTVVKAVRHNGPVSLGQVYIAYALDRNESSNLL